MIYEIINKGIGVITELSLANLLLIKPEVVEITSTAQINNEGADSTSTYVEHDELAVNLKAFEDQLYLKANITAATAAGVSISFLIDTIYGTLVLPEVGNIEANVTGGELGVTNIIIHNASTIPTFDSEFKKLSGSSNYVINVINYISVVFITSTEIIYSINQRT